MKFGNYIYKYSQTLTHQGIVMAFSARATKEKPTEFQIGYSVLMLSTQNPNDDDSWKDFQLLEFATQLRPVGMNLITIDFKEQKIPTADVPFQVLSDGQHVYVFRQSREKTLLVDRFAFDELLIKLINTWEVRYRRSRKVDIPASRKDTFGSKDMEDNYFIEPTTELTMVRNLENGWFSVLILPTDLQEVQRWQIFAYDSTTKKLNSFSILRASDGLFNLTDAIDPETKTVPPESRFSLLLTGDEPGSTLLPFTSGPNAILYMKQERLKNEYGQMLTLKKEARVMVAVAAGSEKQVAIMDFGVGKDGKLAQVAPELNIAPTSAIGTALGFNRSMLTSATLPHFASEAPTTAMTIEAWVNLSGYTSGSDLIIQSASSETLPFTLSIEGGTPQFTVTAGGTQHMAQGVPLDTELWYHLAGTWDGAKAILFLNGQPYTNEGTAPASAGINAGYMLGGDKGFTGFLDEVRLWKIALDRASVLAYMDSSVSNANPNWNNLVGYWKLDEPSYDYRLTTILNSSFVGAPANGTLVGAMWAATSAPIGVSMPPVAWDQNNLNAATTLLTFAKINSAPSFLEGADGQLHLYFQSTNQLFCAVHYNTITARAHYTVAWLAADPDDESNDQSGTLRFIARQIGSLMNNTHLSPVFVTITTDPEDSDYCTLMLRSYTGLAEKWPKVPRSLQSFVEIVNGDAIQTTDDPVALARDLVMYDYTSIQVTPGTGQSGKQPEPGAGSNIFTVLPDDEPDNGMTALVQPTGSAQNLPVLARAGVDCWWIADPLAGALTLQQPGEYVEIFDDVKIATYTGDLNLKGSLCMEGWLNATAYSDETRATLLLFSNPSKEAQYLLALDPQGRLIAANANTARISKEALVPLNQWTHVAANYKTDYGLKLGGSKYLNAGNNVSLDTAEAVTVEGWVKLDQTGAKQVLISKWDNNKANSWQLYIDTDNKPVFQVNCDVDLKTEVFTIKANTALQAGKWHHVAGVYDVAFKKETAIQFLWNKSSRVAIPALTNPLTDAVTVEAWIKLLEPLPKTPGVKWIIPLQNVMQTMDPQNAVVFLLNLDKNVPTFEIFVGSDHKIIKASQPLPYDVWVHLAGTYDKTSGINLYLNGQVVQSSSTGSEGEFQPEGKMENSQVAGDDPYDYLLGGTAQQPNFFNGLINDVRLWNRRLKIDEIRQNMKRPLTGSERGLVGYWPFQDRFGTTAMDLAGVSNAALSNADFIQIEKGAFAHNIYVDGKLSGYRKANVLPHLTETPVWLGSASFKNYLQGTIDDLRLWKVGRMGWEIDYYQTEPLVPNAEGLISEWAFETGSGRVAYDSKSDNNAVILDASVRLDDKDVEAMWLPTWFKSGWELFVNGVKVQTDNYTLPVGFGNNQFLMGAMYYRNTVATFFPGTLNELRLWNAVRTAEQIRDNLNVRLSGKEDGLVGYWPVSEGSGEIVGDKTGFGNNGTWMGGPEPEWITSNAPLGNEMPGVLSIGGPGSEAPTLPTTLQISDTPGAVEYSDLQTNSDGDMIGVMKRCYAYIKEKALNLITGFKVGDLDVQFVGQAQMNPTLIGYIEGAPPLPGENLTVDWWQDRYLGTSSIYLTEAENVAQIYTASRDNGFDMSVDARLGFSFGTQVSLGMLVQTLVYGMNISAGIRANFENTLGWLNEARISTETTTTATKSLSLTGSWEPNSYKIDNSKGNMYIPQNMGYALVRSGTADIYALRLRGTGTLVSYSVVPSPDIPQDTNIIMFKIAPRYVKNGTLDGYIGFQTDKDYSFLQPGERGSYFKPLEAYALKQQIERQMHELKVYYDQFDSGSTGRRTNVVNFQKGDIGDPQNDLANILMGIKDREAISSEEWKKKMARRSLVNTYVWTAEGGLFTEEQQFSTVRESSVGGSYDFLGRAGIYTEIKMSVGVDFSLDALFGGHIRTRSMKTQSEGASFGLHVELSGERTLNQVFEEEEDTIPGTVSVKENGPQPPWPGKVKGYRFMTFYLASSKRNFEDFERVVDENWLNMNNNPDAFALRQALRNTNEVWRVLHRVTYVNRVPETGEHKDSESLTKDVRRPDEDSIGSNSLLIDLLPVEPTDPQKLATLSLETDALLAKLEKDPLWGVRLAKVHDEVKQDIMKYMKGYYEIVQ